MPPLHIGLIAIGGPGWAGGTEYIRNLTRAIAAERTKRGAPGETLLLSSRVRVPDTLQRVIELPSGNGTALGRFLGLPGRRFSRAVRSANLDFIYPLTYDNFYNLGIGVPRRDAWAPTRWAGWIPDFQHRHLPELFGAKEIRKRESGIADLLREAPRVVFSSQSAAEDLRRFHPEHAPKAEVLTFATYPHADWYTEFAEDLSWLPERFFLVSNQFWKHKNHLALFQALRLLRERGVRPVVICTGQLQDFREPEYMNRVLQSLHRLGIASQVVLLGMVERRLQIELMRRCLAVVQPSLFEGWSTVVEDARALGRPCILSGIAVHREQNPPGARFFAPESEEELAAALREGWETLAPGPDLEGEAKARARAEERIAEVGARFLQIANAVCDR